MINKMSVRSLVLICMSILLAIAAVQSFTAYRALEASKKKLEYAAVNTIPSLSMLGDAYASANKLQATLGRHVLAPTIEETRQVDLALQASRSETADILEKYRPFISDSTEQAMYDGVMAKWTAWQSSLDAVRSLSLALKTEEATDAFNGAQADDALSFSNAVKDELKYNADLVSKANIVAEAEGKSATRTLLMTSGTMSGLIIGVLAILIGRVTRPLSSISETMSRMAQGEYDLTVPYAEKKDEIGAISRGLVNIRDGVAERSQKESARQIAIQAQIVNDLGEGLAALKDGRMTFRLNNAFPENFDGLRRDFNEAIEKLSDILKEVGGTTDNVNVAAEEIASAAKDLSQRTERQAASLEETSAAFDQLTQGVKQSAQAAASARDLAHQASQEAQTGLGIVEQAMVSMNAITASSTQMDSIVAMIDSLAFQTNLLALNAGIEAARAGSAGSGFAVVANEVRALAQRSAEAANDIKELISQSSTQVTKGVGLVDQSSSALGRIEEAARKVFELIEQIAQTVVNQSSSITQINVVIKDLGTITQQNAALVEETTAATSSMTERTRSLTTMTRQFDVGASSGRPQQSRRGSRASLAA